MKFKQFYESVLMDDDDRIPEEILELTHTLKRYCSKFIRESGGNPVYRGADLPKIDSQGKEIFYHKKRVRMDRIPSSTPVWFTRYIDEILEPVVGFKPRTQALFVDGNAVTATNYGDVYLIFPIGDFKFTNSPVVFDLYVDFFDSVEPNAKLFDWMKWAIEDAIPGDKLDELDDIFHAAQTKDPSIVFKALAETDYWKPVIKTMFVDYGMYESDNLEQAIKNHTEIMIHCNEYYAVRLSYLKEAGLSASDFMKMLS